MQQKKIGELSKGITLGDKSKVIDSGLEALECEEDTIPILNKDSYLAKLKYCRQSHIKIDEHPTPQQERKLNTALRKMVKEGKRCQAQR